MKMNKRSLKKENFLLLPLIFLLCSLLLSPQEKKEEKKLPTITEEIIVEAERPKDIPLATTSLIKREIIELTTPRDLSEVLSYASGTFVSSGTKNEFLLKIRGFESQSIALLYDGIPIYEPYFNSFDLKTITAEEVESIKVVKGASSVLYGPNTLGGIVNIITRRPSPPSFSLKASYDSNSTSYLSSTGAFRWRSLFFTGFASLEKSDGFRWKKNGENVLRANSDYERKNFTGKIYYYPTGKSEILLEAAYYSSAHGIPYALEFYLPRYWRFKSWDRFQLHLGGTFSFLQEGHLKLRSYYVRHDNVLDSFSSEDMKDLQWESTYKNDSYGIFIIGSLPYSSQNQWKWSLNFRNDKARTQDDSGEEWSTFQHQTFSCGAENHLNLNPRWKATIGISLDHLRKQSGDSKWTLNPIMGVKFHPQDHIDFHLSIAQKSRFPSMKSLYSSQGGNPELKDERGTSYEWGFTFNKEIFLQGAIFFNQIKDLIRVIRLPNGEKTSLNIGKAEILGFELEFKKAWPKIDFSFNYTYLDGKDKVENIPLDLLSKSQLNLAANFMIMKTVSLSLWGLGVSRSEVNAGADSFRIPGYFILNAILSKGFSHWTVFLKAENLFNEYYITEPGFPMKARAFIVGITFLTGK